MDIEDLQGLVAVADRGSITAAAADLAMSQPALSRRLQRLEREIGATLLDRSGRAARLTPAGEHVLGFARSTLGARERLMSELHDPGPVTGTVQIIASTVPGEYLVPELIATFTELHPEAAVRLFESDSAAVATRVLADGWDLGFTGHARDHPDLVHVPIADDEIVLAVPAAHPFAGRGTIEPEHLVEAPLIGREDGSGTQATVDRAFAAAGLERPSRSARLRLGSTQAVVAAVARGLGVGFASIRAVEAHAERRLRAVRIRGLPLTRPLYATYVRERPRAPAVEAFLELIRSRA